MTAEEMKAAESGAQSAPLRIEGVDISPKQDEGVLKVRAGGAGDPGPPGATEPRGPSQPPSHRAWKPPTGHWGRGGADGRLCSLSRPALSGRAATDWLQRLPGLAA